jgi:hypothetical protein
LGGFIAGLTGTYILYIDARFSYHGKQTEKFLQTVPFVTTYSEQTGLSHCGVVAFAISCICAVALVMFNVGAGLITAVAGAAYPLGASIEAIEKGDPELTVKW